MSSKPKTVPPSDNTTVSCYDRHSTLYDCYQYEVVPRYGAALDAVAAAVSERVYDGAQVLDLGCGTGNACCHILMENPSVHCFLLDGSRSSIEIASRKIAGRNGPPLAGYRIADLAGTGWDNGLGAGTFDAVVSTFVLEHLPFSAYKRIVAKCFSLLKPGGWLLAVEAHDEGDLIARFEGQMLAKERGLQNRELAEFVSLLRTRDEKHFFTTKQRKQAWWRDAGFSAVTVTWQYLCIALMAGRRPS